MSLDRRGGVKISERKGKGERKGGEELFVLREGERVPLVTARSSICSDRCEGEQKKKRKGVGLEKGEEERESDVDSS